MTTQGKLLASALLLIALAARPALAATAGQSLILNGKVASTDVRTINGVAYVKVGDVAKALGLIVVKRAGGGYELTRAGGAGQVEGAVQGKVGDLLFDGRWRFQVLSVQTVEAYTFKNQEESWDNSGATTFDRASRTLRPRSGNTLVVLQCRVANGQKSTETLWISPKESHTALADTQGESYPPSDFDVAGAPIQTKPLLPGAKIEFALVFSVPRGTQPKDLVFTLRNNNSSQKANDVRVSLKPE